MSRRPALMFCQRRLTDDQQAQEKRLRIFNHKRNANQNHSEVLPHTCQNGYHEKDNKLKW